MLSSTNNSDNFLQEMIGGATKKPMELLKLFIIFMFILYVPVYSPTLKSNFVFLFNNNPARIIWTFLVFWALCGCLKSSLILAVIVVVLLCLISQQDCNILNYDNDNDNANNNNNNNNNNNESLYSTYQADSEYCPVNDQTNVYVPENNSAATPAAPQNNGASAGPQHNGVSGISSSAGGGGNYSTWMTSAQPSQ